MRLTISFLTLLADERLAALIKHTPAREEGWTYASGPLSAHAPPASIAAPQ
jgi:hypothetical protein